MLKPWLVLRYLRMGSRFVSLTSLFSIFGIAVGVACLVLTMSIVNGFMSTIHSSVIDYVGHVLVYKQGGIDNSEELKDKVREWVPNLREQSLFTTEEALISANGKIYGAILRSQDSDTHSSKIIKKRMSQGEWLKAKSNNKIVLGKAWQEKLNIQVGDDVKVLISKSTKGSTYQLQPKVKTFQVKGFLDLGKYDYNERLAFIQPGDMQELIAPKKRKATALMLWIDSDQREMAEKLSLELGQKLGVDYYVKDWYSHNRNFLSAVAYEKWILFLVLSIMIVAASFNVASSLFISVLKRYRDISILRSMGCSKKFIQSLFSTQGLIIGVIGVLVGLVLGLVLCWFVPHLPFFHLPADIYKLDRLPIEIRWLDFIWISLFSLVITYLSTLLPARKGAKMANVKGLNYE